MSDVLQIKVTKNVQRIIDFARAGGLQRDLPPDDSKAIRRLVDAGFIRRERWHSGYRGSPTFRLSLLRELPTKKARQCRPRATPFRDAIIAAIGDREMMGGEIAAALGRDHFAISGQLLQLCRKGVLLRRRMQGQLSGCAVTSEWFLYRTAPGADVPAV